MRSATCALVLLSSLAPAPAFAVPVTFEFTAIREVPSTYPEVVDGRGYITFETEPHLTESVDTIGDGNVSRGVRSNSYEGVLLSAYMTMGDDDEIHIPAGTPSQGAIYADYWNYQSPLIEYAAGAGAKGVDGRTLSFYYDRRCTPPACLESTFQSLLANDDLNHIPGMYAGLGVVLFVRDGFGEPSSTWTAHSFHKVPEPATLGLLGAGLLGAFARCRRRIAH